MNLTPWNLIKTSSHEIITPTNNIRHRARTGNKIFNLNNAEQNRLLHYSLSTETICRQLSASVIFIISTFPTYSDCKYLNNLSLYLNLLNKLFTVWKKTSTSHVRYYKIRMSMGDNVNPSGKHIDNRICNLKYQTGS